MSVTIGTLTINRRDSNTDSTIHNTDPFADLTDALSNEDTELRDLIYERTKEIYERNSARSLPDRAAEGNYRVFYMFLTLVLAHLTMSCLVLASYEVLTKHYMLHSDKVMEMLQHCICGNFHKFMSILLKLPVKISENPIPLLESSFGTFSRLKGKSFSVEIEHESIHQIEK
jgi:hypothetical protein